MSLGGEEQIAYARGAECQPSPWAECGQGTPQRLTFLFWNSDAKITLSFACKILVCNLNSRDCVWLVLVVLPE